MLNEALMRKARFAISQKRRFSTGGGWFWQCGTYPDPDLLTLGGTTEQWSLKTGETIGETAIEFVAPGATEAVNGMKRRYDACRTFTSDGFTYRNITALPLPKAAGFDDQVSWCQDASGFSLCLGVYRRGNLVLQLFGQGATKNSSRLLLMIGTLAAQRALHLATPPVDNLLAPSTIALIHRA